MSPHYIYIHLHIHVCISKNLCFYIMSSPEPNLLNLKSSERFFVFKSKVTALAVKFHEFGDVKLWFLQNLHLRNKTPRFARWYENCLNLSQVKMGIKTRTKFWFVCFPKHSWKVFLLKQHWVKKTIGWMFDVLNRTEIASGWGLLTP